MRKKVGLNIRKNKPASSKQHFSLVKRNQKRQRLIQIAGVFVIICAIALTGYGVYDSQYKPWRENALTINDTSLTMRQYVARARYTLQTQGITDPGKYSDLASLLPDITDMIVNNELMSQAASEYGITITDEQITEQIKKEVMPESETGEAATEDFDNLYKEQLKQYNMTDEEYRLMTRIQLINTTLVQDYLNKEVADTAPQVHVNIITVATEEEATEIKQRLDDGEDFATVAMEKSLDSTAESGGDLGWYAYDALSKDYADVIFNLAVGEISEPVANSNATSYYIFKVSEKEESRTLDETNLTLVQAKYVESWLKQRIYSSAINYNFTTDKYAWVAEHI